VVGSTERALSMWRGLLDAGVYTNIVLPPACHVDACLLRTSYSAAHTSEQIDCALAVFEQVGRALSIIDAAA
jgi:8-amino-7-oxononanoate synthase